jgi:hypothetical protein
VQQFKPAVGTQLQWTNRSLAEDRVIQSGTAVVDSLGLVTLPGVKVDKGRNRLVVKR